MRRAGGEPLAELLKPSPTLPRPMALAWAMAWLMRCKVGNPTIPGAGQKAGVVAGVGGGRTGWVALYSVARSVCRSEGQGCSNGEGDGWDAAMLCLFYR